MFHKTAKFTIEHNRIYLLRLEAMPSLNIFHRQRYHRDENVTQQLHYQRLEFLIDFSQSYYRPKLINVDAGKF